MQHPLEFISVRFRRKVFLVAFGLTIACFTIFQVFLNPLLITAAAPSGIVSFELAGTPENSDLMLLSWDSASMLINAFGLGFDFLFMPIYAIALSSGILLSANRRRGVWTWVGNVLGWGAFVATLFDSVENIALFSILANGAQSPDPQIAFWCASIKFGLIGVGVIYALIGWLLPQK